ncbi:MAG: hypothetical protein ACHQD8_07720 [Chitinophagales bacterium]
MKSIDFSKPGGIPLTQDLLDYLQTAYKEAISGLAAVGGAGPIIVSGMGITKTLVTGSTYNYTITDGWVLYNGDMLRVLAGGISGVDESVNDVYVELTPGSTPLTYNDGSTPNVINDVTCSLISQTIGTADDATHFLLKGLKKYGRENTEGHIAVSTLAADGGVTGDIYYRKNFLNNTLQLRGFLGCNNAQNFASIANIHAMVLCTLPPGYWTVSSRAYFTAEIKFLFTTRFKDDLGVGWLERIVCSLDTVGNIRIWGVRPDISIAAYSLEFFVILPLD